MNDNSGSHRKTSTAARQDSQRGIPALDAAGFGGTLCLSDAGT
jgi:hypothetical protein